MTERILTLGALSKDSLKSRTEGAQWYNKSPTPSKLERNSGSVLISQEYKIRVSRFVSSFSAVRNQRINLNTPGTSSRFKKVKERKGACDGLGRICPLCSNVREKKSSVKTDRDGKELMRRISCDSLQFWSLAILSICTEEKSNDLGKMACSRVMSRLHITSSLRFPSLCLIVKDEMGFPLGIFSILSSLMDDESRGVLLSA